MKVELWKTIMAKKEKEKKYIQIEQSKYRTMMRRESQLLKIQALIREVWNSLNKIKALNNK